MKFNVEMKLFDQLIWI